MASPTSGTTENPEVPRPKGGTYSERTPAAMDDIDAAYCDERLRALISIAQSSPLVRRTIAQTRL